MSLLRRRMMMNMEDEEMAEWKLIGTKKFSESDLGTRKFDFECSGCTEFFICDDNLISNQSMGYRFMINDVEMSVNHHVMTKTGELHREVSIELKGNRWCEMTAYYDYAALGLQNVQYVIGKKNTDIGVANKISILQSAVEDYQIYDGTIEIWGR